jgi:hypothetical protein
MRHRSKKKGTKTKANSPKPIREKTQKGQPQGRHAKTQQNTACLGCDVTPEAEERTKSFVKADKNK